MKKELKAVLLTAIVYPGAGHFSLKKHLIGCIFAGVFTLLLFMTLGDILAIAQCSANEILAGKIPAFYKRPVIHQVNVHSLGNINIFL